MVYAGPQSIDHVSSKSTLGGLRPSTVFGGDDRMEQPSCTRVAWRNWDTACLWRRCLSPASALTKKANKRTEAALSTKLLVTFIYILCNKSIYCIYTDTGLLQATCSSPENSPVSRVQTPGGPLYLTGPLLWFPDNRFTEFSFLLHAGIRWFSVPVQRHGDGVIHVLHPFPQKSNPCQDNFKYFKSHVVYINIY